MKQFLRDVRSHVGWVLFAIWWQREMNRLGIPSVVVMGNDVWSKGDGHE